MEDLTVNGPGSPISLRKFLTATPDLKELTVLVTNDVVIAKDDPGLVYITSDDCKLQALHFLENIFDGIRVPHYAVRHILFMFKNDRDAYKIYPDANAVKLAVLSKTLTADSEDYKFVLNKFTYGKEDPEFLQVLGLIQLIAGSLNQGLTRIYIEHPETHLHPKRQSAFVSMWMALKDEYMPKPPAPTIYDPETASIRLDVDKKAEQPKKEKKK